MRPSPLPNCLNASRHASETYSTQRSQTPATTLPPTAQLHASVVRARAAGPFAERIQGSGIAAAGLVAKTSRNHPSSLSSTLCLLIA